MPQSICSKTITDLLEAAAVISSHVAQVLGEAADAAAEDEINQAIGGAMGVSSQLSALMAIYNAALSLHGQPIE